MAHAAEMMFHKEIAEIAELLRFDDRVDIGAVAFVVSVIGIWDRAGATEHAEFHNTPRI